MSLETLKQSINRASDWADSLYNVKAPSPAPQNPLPLAITGGQFNAGGGQNKLALTKEQYEHNRGRVYSAIRVICQRIAGQQVFVARINASGDPERSLQGMINKGRFQRDWLSKDVNPHSLELIEDHPICDTIDNPNELMVRAVLWNITVANLLITGRSLWVLSENSDGKPEIVPIPTTWAKPVPKNGKMFFEWQVAPPNSMDEPIIVPGDRMAHFYFPDPSNPFMAISPLQMIARAILADEAISEAQWFAFNNGAFPSMAFIAGDVETADGPQQVELENHQKITLMSWIRQQYSGMRNFGLPILLDAIIKDVKRLSDKPHEMAFLESSGLTKTQIFEGFGVNPISAGQVEGANRASSAVADEHLLVNAVNPILILLSQGMTKWLGPVHAVGNERLKIWIAPAETRDAEMTFKKWDLARLTFSTTRNENRAWIGLPWKEGFDNVFIPLNMVSSTSQTNGNPPDTTRESKVTRKKQIQEMWLKQHSSHELPFAKELESFFTQQREATIATLEEMGRDFKSKTSDAIASNIFNPNAWDEKLIETVEPFLLRQMFAGAATELGITHATKQFDNLVDEFNPKLPDELVEAIRQFFDELIIQDYWKDINRTTLNNLSRALERGIVDGDTISEMSSRVFEAMGDSANRNRAAMIARTECLPGDACIDGALATAVYRRWYDGPMVEIVTNGGRKFTGTPNHPVLTLRGWVALGDVQKSDSLICDERGVKSSGSNRDQNIEAPPATIGEIYDSLAAIRIAERETTGKPDFHGDGMNGYVDVFRTDRVLELGRFISVNEFSVKGVLSPADARQVVSAANRNLFAKGFTTELCRNTSVPCLESVTPHKSRYCSTDNSELPTDFFGRDFGLVECGDFINGQSLTQAALVPVSEFSDSCLLQVSHNTGFNDYSPDCIGSEAHLGTDCSVAESGKIQLDSVSSLRFIERWKGHVYNLTTTEGYFISNGLYTANTTGAMNAGHHATRQMLAEEGVVVGSEWLTVGDIDVRGNRPKDEFSHVIMHEVKVKIGKDFDVSGEKAPYPGHHSLSAGNRIH